MERPDHLRREPASSLATHLILLVFLATFVSAAAVSWISIETARHQLWRHIRSELPAQLDRAGDALRDWLVTGRVATSRLLAGPRGRERLLALARERLRAAAHDPGRAVAGGAAPGAGADPVLEALAAPALEGSSPIRALALLAPDGRLLAATEGMPRLPRALRQRILRTPPPVFGGAASAEGPVLVTPLRVPAADGRTAAILVGSYDARSAAALLATRLPVPGSTLWLLDGRDYVLLRIGEDAQEAPVPPAQPLSFPPTGSVREYVDHAGRHLVGSALRLEPTGWRLVLEEPYGTAFAPVLASLRRLLVIDVSVVALASLVAFLVTARIVRPIEALSDAARRIAEGGPPEPLPGRNRGDEIGILARTLDHTLAELRQSQGELEAANRRLRDQNLSLQASNEILEQLSITDGLTRLHNHRFFQDHLSREIKRSTRTGEPLSMLLIDIDDFKRLNDRLGHAAGDELLRRVAQVLAGAIRDSDLLARYGGEEFVIVASNTDLAGATVLAEKVRMSVAEQPFLLDERVRPARVTVSLGVSEYKGDRKRFFRSADRALYQAKAAGKDCVRTGD